MPAATHAGGETRPIGPLPCRIGFRSCASLVILLASAIGCDRAKPPAYIERLVDDEHRARIMADFGGGPGPLPTPAVTSRPALSPHASASEPSPLATPATTAAYPRADIEDDTRLVLVAPTIGIVALRPHFNVPPSGSFTQIVLAEESLAGASRVLLMPRVQLGTEWTDLPTSVVAVDHRSNGPHVTIDLQFPESLAGQQVQLFIPAVAVDWGPRISMRTAPLLIPRHSRLDLATGILEPAWSQGPVLFTVEACEDHECTRLYETRMDPAQPADRNWRDAAIPLESCAGKTVSLVFTSTLAPLSAEDFSLPVWANPTIRVPRKADPSSPNVVLLSLDTLGARHLPTYGYFRDTAPILRRAFESGGTVFDHLVAAATSTPQSHMSMFTGLHPLEHGITAGTEQLDQAILTVTEHARAAGVATGAITEDGWLGATTGFGRGFDEYRENKSADIMEPQGQVDRTFGAAKAWLRRHADQRFFLFLHTFQVHDPYAPPAQYTALFSTDERGDTIDTDPPSHVREARDYDREIRYVDDELGALLGAMDDLGLSENTVFIVTSDHGEAFLEHGFLRHSTFLFEEVTHVPLLMRGPGVPRGLRVAAPVGHVDLANTIASFLGVEPPRGSHGTDLRRAFRDGSSAVDGSFYFTDSWGSVANGPDGELIPFFAPAFAVRQGQRKAARYKTEDGSRRSECYDLAADPGEQTNLCPGTTPEPADLAAALDAYPEAAARHRLRLVATNGAPSEGQRKVTLDPEHEEKLRALGYIR